LRRAESTIPKVSVVVVASISGSTVGFASRRHQLSR
jgi:hypothetical protein